MIEETGVKESLNMSVDLSESELAEFELEAKPDQPEPDQPEPDAKSKGDDDSKDKDEDDKKTDSDEKDKDEQGVKNPDDKDSKDSDSDEKDKDPEDDDPDPVLVEYAGHKYTQSEFKALIEGNMKGADYTQKTQELSDLRASIEPFINLVDQLKGEDSKEIATDIRTALVEEKGDDAGKLFDQILNFQADKFEHPSDKKVKELQAKVDKATAEKAFVDAQSDFRTAMKTKGVTVSRKEAEEVGKFTLEYYTRTGAGLDLEDAYKLMKADGWRTKANEIEKKAKEEKDKQGHDAIPDKSKGVKDIVTDKGPRNDMDFTMADVGDLNLFE